MFSELRRGDGHSLRRLKALVKGDMFSEPRRRDRHSLRRLKALVKGDMFSEPRRRDGHCSSECAEDGYRGLVGPIFQEGVHLHADLVHDL